MLTGTSVLYHGAAKAKDAKGESDGAPRWKFLGDDASLRETIKESAHVLLICVYQTSLERVKPPFAEVVLRATVVQVVKGAHKLGDRISISFHTDSLPEDEGERTTFIDGAAIKNLGALKMAFLDGDKANEYGCEWLDVPAFDPEMLAFAMKNSR
jgi:hypothetical protein